MTDNKNVFVACSSFKGMPISRGIGNYIVHNLRNNLILSQIVKIEKDSLYFINPIFLIEKKGEN